MSSLSKKQSMLSRESIQNAFFFFRIMLPFRFRKTLSFGNISVITEGIYLKLRVCVPYPKSNPYRQGRQSKMLFFSELNPFLDLDFLSSIKHPIAERWHSHASCCLRFSLTHALIHHFGSVQNSKKLQTTTEMWLLENFKIQIA